MNDFMAMAKKEIDLALLLINKDQFRNYFLDFLVWIFDELPMIDYRTLFWIIEDYNSEHRPSELLKIISEEGLEDYIIGIIDEYEQEIIQKRDTSDISLEDHSNEREIKVQDNDIFTIYCPFCKKIGSYEPLDVGEETDESDNADIEMKHILFTCPQHGEIMVFWKEG